MKRKIKIESLVLDHKNPRLPNPMDSEASIIEHMISEQQTMALLEDKVGFLLFNQQPSYLNIKLGIIVQQRIVTSTCQPMMSK